MFQYFHKKIQQFLKKKTSTFQVSSSDHQSFTIVTILSCKSTVTIHHGKKSMEQ